MEDRAKKYAVLQTLEFTGYRVFSLVLTAEGLVLSTLGGLFGIGAAMAVLAASGLSLGAEAVTIAFTPSIRLTLVGTVVASITGAFAGIAPAWHAARTEIVTGLRHG